MERTEPFLAIKKSNLCLGLKSIDILILSQVEEFQNNKHECYMTNEQFSNLFGESVSKIKRSLDKLEELNIIKRRNSFVQGNGKSTKQRVLVLNDKSKWKVHNEPTKLDDEEEWKVHNEPTNDKWKVHSEPTKMDKTENGRFIMNRPNEMEGSKSDFGRFKNAKWKVHNEPIKDNLKENLKSNLENGKEKDGNLVSLEGYPLGIPDGNFVSSDAHPSGSPEHPSDAASLKAKPEQTEQLRNKSNKKSAAEKENTLLTLSIEDLERIQYLYRNRLMEYPEMYEEFNLKRSSLGKDIIEKEIPKIIEEKKRKAMADYLDSDLSLIRKISQYSNCSESEVKDSMVRLGIQPDNLIACFEDSDCGHMYKKKYWEDNDFANGSYADYWDWVKVAYDLNVDGVLKRRSTSFDVANVVVENDGVDDAYVDDDIDLSWL